MMKYLPHHFPKTHPQRTPAQRHIPLTTPLHLSFWCTFSCTFFSSDKTQSYVTVIGCTRKMVNSVIYRPRFTHFLFVFEQKFKSHNKAWLKTKILVFLFLFQPDQKVLKSGLGFRTRIAPGIAASVHGRNLRGERSTRGQNSVNRLWGCEDYL